MHYSIEPRERRYVKGYGFMSFAKWIKESRSVKNLLKLLVKKSNWRFNW